MLYDPKLEGADRVYEGVSLRALIAWLETKPASETYEYVRPDRCAVAQFVQETTGWVPRERMGCIGIGDADPERLYLERIVNSMDQTFGGALERARSTLAARQGA